MKHTTSDSDVSPSRESTQATPVYNSPLEYPSHQSSVGPHARASSASRFPGNLLRSPSGGGGGKAATWKHEVDVIDEDDGEYDDDGELSRRSCVAAFWFSLLVLVFTLVCLVVWGAARRYKPTVIVKSLTVENFYAGQGVDHTGVPTKLVTVNCSLKIEVENPSTMFGIHVSSTSVQLMYYSQIPIANGQLDRFYQPKASRHVASVILHGEKIPLYGAGADTRGTVPLKLHLAVKTTGYVIGMLVRVTHAMRANCPVVVSDRPIRFTESACIYT